MQDPVSPLDGTSVQGGASSRLVGEQLQDGDSHIETTHTHWYGTAFGDNHVKKCLQQGMRRLEHEQIVSDYCIGSVDYCKTTHRQHYHAMCITILGYPDDGFLRAAHLHQPCPGATVFTMYPLDAHRDDKTDTLDQAYARYMMYACKGKRPRPLDTDTNFNFAAWKSIINYDEYCADQRERRRVQRNMERRAEYRRQRAAASERQLEIDMFGVPWDVAYAHMQFDDEVAQQAGLTLPQDETVDSTMQAYMDHAD